MRYVKRYVQQTIKEDNPVIFDEKVNEVYIKASKSGITPEVNFVNGLGLCASIRYFVSESIPENAKDECELKGIKHICYECPYFEAPSDKRIKQVRCTRGEVTKAELDCCDIFYEELLGGMIDENEIRSF